MVIKAKDARKLALTRDEIDAVAKQLNYDWAKLALAASACDIGNLETMTADEAGKLLESLKADAQEVARASV
jgi:cell division protein FtsL